tara:strand:+ start:12270 stop:12563 length:294 start_codon:yes stop_codon:yes gene_type:complete
VFVIFDSEEAANAREKELSSALGYPHEETKTERYSQAFKHAKKDEWALEVFVVWSPARGRDVDVSSMLTKEEFFSLVNKSALTAGGWFDFPEPEELG